MAKLLFGSIFLGTLMLIGCGQPFGSESTSNSVGVMVQEEYQKFFTDEQINAVYSEATEVRADGTIWPVSKDPSVLNYTNLNAPEFFKQRYNNFNFGNEIRGYINLGVVQNPAFQSRLVSSFEAISTWKEIKKDNGANLFEDAYTIDRPGGRRINDAVDGIAPINPPEVHQSRMITRSQGMKVLIDGIFDLSNDAGFVSVLYKTTKDISTILSGTVVKAGGMRMDFIFMPYKNGWLFYGANAVQVDRYADKYDAAEGARIIANMFRWIKQNTIQPLE